MDISAKRMKKRFSLVENYYGDGGYSIVMRNPFGSDHSWSILYLAKIIQVGSCRPYGINNEEEMQELVNIFKSDEVQAHLLLEM